MHIRTYLTNALQRAAHAAFAKNSVSVDTIIIEKPKNPSYGDFSTPLAMLLARSLRRKSADIARDIMTHFSWDEEYVVPDPHLQNCLTGGFINFTLSRTYLEKTLEILTHSPTTFGRGQTAEPQKVLLEFVSANPTGPMVVVNARAAAIGDVTGRCHEWIGNDVWREYYVNDFGNQIDLLARSILCRYHQEAGQDFPFPEEGYEGEYISVLAREIADAIPEIASMDDSARLAIFRREALARNVARQKQVLRDYGVEYNQFFFESSLHESGMPAAVLSDLQKKSLTYQKEGATWFASTSFGDEKDRVLVRTDGTPTYFLADLAYHMHKADRGFDLACTFWGPDHHGYLPRLEGAVKALQVSNTRFKNFIIQQVNLLRNGKPFRMSKRRGTFVTVDDLVDEVGVDAARYFFLMRKLSTHFDFDLDLACKKSDDNPVFYVQYAHARTCSLLRHAESRGFTMEAVLSASAGKLTQPEEVALLKALADFPAIVVQVVNKVEPHLLTVWVETLAATFHSFYQKHRIVTDDHDLSRARILLTCGVRNAIRLVLDLLGVSSPEQM